MKHSEKHTWFIRSSGTTEAGSNGREPTMTPDPRPRPTARTIRPRGLCGTRAPEDVVLLFRAAAPLAVDDVNRLQTFFIHVNLNEDPS